ncbi:hypothetical protein BH23ACT6_BH23ACT6_02080 [soil metagenome]
MPRGLFRPVVSALAVVCVGTVGFIPLTASAAPVATDLMISEYVEGSGRNKALELYNGTDSDVDLSGYRSRSISTVRPRLAWMHR